jgi:hypothetical protein
MLSLSSVGCTLGAAGGISGGDKGLLAGGGVEGGDK